MDGAIRLVGRVLNLDARAALLLFLFLTFRLSREETLATREKVAERSFYELFKSGPLLALSYAVAPPEYKALSLVMGTVFAGLASFVWTTARGAGPQRLTYEEFKKDFGGLVAHDNEVFAHAFQDALDDLLEKFGA